MLTKALVAVLLLTQWSSACKHKQEKIPDLLIVNSNLVKKAAQPVVEFTFDKPLYWETDGRFIEHGTLPAKMKRIECNRQPLGMTDSTKDKYFMVITDSLLMDKPLFLWAQDMENKVYSGEIRINQKSYLASHLKNH